MYYYYTRYPRDPWHIKLLVSVSGAVFAEQLVTLVEGHGSVDNGLDPSSA